MLTVEPTRIETTAYLDIDVAADGTVLGVDQSGALGSFDTDTQAWDAVAGDWPSIAQVAVGRRDAVWGLTSEGQTYHGALTGKPTRVEGALSAISAAADDSVWAINPAGEALHLNTSSGVWELVATPARFQRIAVGSVEHVAAIDAAGRLYRLQAHDTWEQLEGTFKDVSVDESGLLCAIAADGHATIYMSADASWSELPAVLRRVAIGSPRCVWGLDTEGTPVDLTGGHILLAEHGQTFSATNTTAPMWHFGEPFYVSLYALGDGDPILLGWLGNAGVESDYAQPVASDVAGPPVGAAPVQWVFDAQKGNATDQASYEAELAKRPRYLSSQGRVLGGSGDDGFYPYWWSANIEEGYPLTATATGEHGLVTLSRVSSTDPPGSAINTYGSKYLGYYKDGNQSVIGFGFVAAATLNVPTHPTWIGDRQAIIGNRPLPQIVIPGSHDAGSYQISRGGGAMTSRAQQVDIKDQLLSGSRFLDLRTDMYQDVWYMHHGSDWTDVRFDHVVEQLGWFLDNYPNEFVLVSLLVAGTQGVPGMSGDYKNAWQMLFNRVHAHHLNYTDEAGNKTYITQVTPNSMQQAGKNLLAFSWGAAVSWYFDVDTITGQFVRYAEKNDPLAPGTTRIFVSPWPSKPEGQAPQGDIADLEGVYLDWNTLLPPNASDMYAAYLDYQRAGGLWNLQTNVPWKITRYPVSLYSNHLFITPGIVRYLQGGQISRTKANIINMDYLGDTVVNARGSYDLVSAVIALNDT